MLELAEEALDQITLAIKCFAEAWFPLAIGFCRDVGNSALGLDQVADAIGIIGFVSKNDGARIETIEQVISGGAIMGLPGGQAEPDREPLRINDGVDLGCEPAS